jgi:hypothetical protein
MTEILITNIQTNNQAKEVLHLLKATDSDLIISYGLNETENSYPSLHTILRFEGNKVNALNVLTALISLGYKCEILEDKVCV